MGASAAAAQDPPDFEMAHGAAGFDTAEVGAVADQGAVVSAGAGKLGGIYGFDEAVIRFLRNGVAFIGQYGYHNLAGGIILMGVHGVFRRQERTLDGGLLPLPKGFYCMITQTVVK